VVLKETTFCNGKGRCRPVRDPKNKRQLCAVEMRWAICLDDLNKVHVWVRGDHGPKWRVDLKAMKIAPFVRAKILEADGLDHGPGGHTTPMGELLRIQAQIGDLDDATRDIVPTLKQLQGLLGYERACARQGGGSIIDGLARALADERIRAHVLYPGPEDRSLHEEVRNRDPFFIMLMAKRARYLIRQWGHQIIGLDGLFKLSKMRWPVWAVVVQDTQGHAWPVVFVFASIERTEILARALRCLHRHVVEDGEPWKPIVMIDKDEVERGAVAAMGWEYLLCDFHIQKTWRAVLRQTSLRGTPPKYIH